MSTGAQATTPLDIPVAVPGDLTLIEEPGLLAWAGAFTAFSGGFGFVLRITADIRDPARVMPPGFALHREDRAHDTWLEIAYPGPRALRAEFGVSSWPADPEGVQVEFVSGAGRAAEGTAWMRWRVSPLPPPGTIRLSIHLNGQDGPHGTAALDTSPLLEAARTVEQMQP